MNKIDRAGRFSLGLILGLILVVLLVFLILESWFLYKNGNNQIVYKNDKVALGGCCLVQKAQCCPEPKPKASSKQKKPKAEAKKPPAPVHHPAPVISKQVATLILVEPALPTLILVEPSLPATAYRSRQSDGGLLDGVN